MRNLSREPWLYIRVLQNGHPIGDVSAPGRQKKRYELSCNGEGPLSLPFYPLARSIFFLESSPKGITLFLQNPFQGFVMTQGLCKDLNPQHKDSSFPLDKGDYAVLSWNDLCLLIKVAQAPRAHISSLKSAYKSPFGFWLWNSSQEKIASWFGILCALISIIPALSWAFFSPAKRPTQFEELEHLYTLPFIHEDYLESAPEALHEKLNRQAFLPSVVAYYRQWIAMMSLNFSPKLPTNLLLPTSVKFYQNKKSLRQKSLENFIEKQKTFNLKLGETKVSMPLILGYGFSQELDALLEKMKSLKSGYDTLLSHRRKISDAFSKDPNYNWGQYMELAETETSEAERLAGIKAFSYETNEQKMYAEARNMAQKAKWLRKRSESILENDREDVVVSAPSVRWLTSFPIKKAGTLEEALQGSQLGKRSKVLEEPLIGYLPPEKVDRVIKNQRFRLTMCYRLALNQRGIEEGFTRWRWRITSKGRVEHLELLGNSLTDAPFLNCLRGVIQSWVFPKPERGSLLVEHEFQFSKEDTQKL